MVLGRSKPPEVGSTVIEVSATEAVAGADIILSVRVSCSPVCDLRGQSLMIKDENGIQIATADFVEFDGAATTTGEFAVKAPIKAGTFAWLAVCPAHAEGDVAYEEAAGPFSVAVKPHRTSMVVWDVPSAVVVGDRLRLKVGIKCLAGCRLADRGLLIYDHHGTEVGTGRLRSEPWPGTAAMYYDEVDVQAPDAEGQYKWEAKAAWSETELPHEASVSGFGVRVTPLPDCLVTIEAIDSKDKAPVAGAVVVMHPYRARTDERGVAELRVRKGDYSILVSKTKFDPMARSVQVAGDFHTRVELVVEAPDSDGTEIYQ